MKATELMIGDWVMYQDKPIQVQFIYNDGYEDKVAEMEELYSPNFNEVEPYLTKKEISIKTISPIPLTPEILKKNGFNEQIKRFHKEGYLFRIELGISYTYSNPRCEITAYVMETYNSTESYRKNPPSGFRFFVSVFEENDRMKEAVKVKKHIYCVHELQHALRLCGLEELADNFQLFRTFDGCDGKTFYEHPQVFIQPIDICEECLRKCTNIHDKRVMGYGEISIIINPEIKED